jgi:hypothetical protein
VINQKVGEVTNKWLGIIVVMVTAVLGIRLKMSATRVL